MRRSLALLLLLAAPALAQRGRDERSTPAEGKYLGGPLTVETGDLVVAAGDLACSGSVIAAELAGDVTTARLDISPGGDILADGSQAAAVADLAISYGVGSGPATDGALTIALAAVPTTVELLEYVAELEARVEALRDALVGVGILAP